MKRGLVLCGGGSLGSYEMGVWKYFHEKDIHFDLVTGSSIGSLIGAMYVSGDYEACLKLWETITVDDVITNGINIKKKMFSEDKAGSRLVPLTRSYIANGGVDNAPFKKLLASLVDPKKVKDSKIPLGIVVTSYPAMKEVDVISHELKEEEIMNYLLSSSACWPIFPMMKIGKKRFVDGGFTNNMPIDLAIKMGATEIVAVQLRAYPPVPQHIELTELPFVTTLSANIDLGFMMNFDHETLQNNMALGYLDAKKKFGDAIGNYYTFTSLGHYKEMANSFAYSCVKGNPSLWKIIRKDLEKEGYHPKTSADYFLATLEIIGKWINITPYKEYTVQEFIKTTKERCVELLQGQDRSGEFRETHGEKTLTKNEQIPFLAYLYRSFNAGHKASHANYYFKRSPKTILIKTLMQKLYEK